MTSPLLFQLSHGFGTFHTARCDPAAEDGRLFAGLFPNLLPGGATAALSEAADRMPTAGCCAISCATAAASPAPSPPPAPGIEKTFFPRRAGPKKTMIIRRLCG